ncbi:DNA-directed RNA polymerase subunit beta [Alteribacillus iranensis]|uniref:DNA-directed RNA polymerase subunit beta n=1 Tax=Alteribacillus iranensis TaxID=930128 RepID=A0A1I2BXL9_9BACI|nr:DNA-directed RNA polymerase subunit beta [Alteribacillus iranensis]SFE60857.1 DNA-directed RNA polymerase subunit beta [Alteribacillus iranensis]
MTYKEDTANRPASQNEENQIEETRTQRRKQKAEEKKEASAGKSGKKWARLWARIRAMFSRSKTSVRMVPIWARLLIVLALLIISITAGLLVGYSLVGEGDSLGVLSLERWRELYHFIQGE